MIYVKIKNFYGIGNEKTHFLLMRNIVSLARIAYIVLLSLADFKLQVLIEITQSPGHVIHYWKDHKNLHDICENKKFVQNR